MARNKVVLESVMAERNLRDWKDEILSEIHNEQRVASQQMKHEDRRKTKSMALSRRSMQLTKRIY